MLSPVPPHPTLHSLHHGVCLGVLCQYRDCDGQVLQASVAQEETVWEETLVYGEWCKPWYMMSGNHVTRRVETLVHSEWKAGYMMSETLVRD